MSRKAKNDWTAPSLQDFNVSSRKRIKPDPDVVDYEVPEPKSVGELAVNPRKIAEVRKWLTWSQNERAPILLVSGPSGSGKTVTVKLLAKSTGFSVIEWISPISKNIGPNLFDDLADKNVFFDVSEGKKFDDFVCRSSRYPSLFQPKKRNLILVKDFPNTFVWKPDSFHIFLEKYEIHGKSPIVFVVTDDENMNLHSFLFPNHLKSRLGITNIKFNPVSDTFLKKNLKALTERIKGGAVPSECLEKVTQNAVGDLRTATTEIMVRLRTGELSFSSTQTSKRRKRNSADEEKSVIPDAGLLYSRDHGYDFYKKMGRILYPKRMTEIPQLAGPSVLVHNILEIADNWSKTNLSFLHENYLQTCSKLEDATAAADCFSFCDVLSRHHDLELLSGIITVAGLMVANTQPKKSGFLPFKKSVNLDTTRNHKCIFSEACVARFGTNEKLFALDVAPMKMFVPLQLEFSVRTLGGGNVRGVDEKMAELTSSQITDQKGDRKVDNHDNSDSSGSSSEEIEIEDVDDD